jgi:hypothetical protein
MNFLISHGAKFTSRDLALGKKTSLPHTHTHKKEHFFTTIAVLENQSIPNQN